METLEEIMARLRLRASCAHEAEMLPTPTGPLQEEESMPVLTDEVKQFIVNGLACFDTPSQVAEAVKVTFDLEVSRQQVYAYDPNCSQPPAHRWKELHAATRQALLRDAAEIGVAHRTVRLRMLDRLAHRCEKNGVVLALACLEQAAKECGGIYENRRPIVVRLPVSHPSELSNGSDAMVTSNHPPQILDLCGAVDPRPLQVTRQ